MNQDSGETHEVINEGGKTQEVKIIHKKVIFQNKTGTKLIIQTQTDRHDVTYASFWLKLG